MAKNLFLGVYLSRTILFLAIFDHQNQSFCLSKQKKCCNMLWHIILGGICAVRIGYCMSL